MTEETIQEEQIANTMANNLAQEIRARGFKPESLANRDAAAWVMSALDPADSAGSNGAILGIPDHNDQPSTVICWRQLEQLAADSSLALADGDTWDFDMMTFEGPYLLAAGQMRKSANATVYKNFWFLNTNFDFSPNGPLTTNGPFLQTDAQNNVSINQLAATNWQQNVAAFRPVHSAMTAEFVGATLTDQGTIAAAQLPNMWQRKTFSEVSVEPAASGGVSTSGLDTPVSYVVWGSAVETGVSGTSQSVGLPKISTLMMVAPGSRTWAARKGVYLPLRYQQPDMEYTSTTTPGAVVCFEHPWTTGADSAHSETIPARVFPNGVSSRGNTIVGAMSTNMRVGAMCARGLAKTTTFSLTFRNGFEILPVPASSWSANLTPSCVPEAMAVEAYFKLRHELPDAFPSSWNVFGLVRKVAKGALGAVRKLAKPAKKAVKSLPDLQLAQPDAVPARGLPRMGRRGQAAANLANELLAGRGGRKAAIVRDVLAAYPRK